MKIAYFGYDFFICALERLLADGHELVAVRTFEVDGNFLNTNDRLLALSKRLNVPVEVGRPSKQDVDHIRDKCDLLLVMGFEFKVPVIDGLRAVNLHPTLLPYGRGQFPLPWLILYRPEYSGLTLHQLTEQMDEGPILAQMPITIAADESLESLCAKMQIEAGPFVAQVLADLDTHWSAASLPADRGSEWQASESDWTLDWEANWQEVVRKVRAFGGTGSGTTLDGKDWEITAATGWAAAHSFRPGTIVHKMPIGLVVAASDGMVLLINPMPLEN